MEYVMIQQYCDPFFSFQNMFREDPVARVAFLNLIYLFICYYVCPGASEQNFNVG